MPCCSQTVACAPTVTTATSVAHIKLPMEIQSYILSMLDVVDKLNAVEAFTRWEQALHCSSSWNTLRLKFTNYDRYFGDYRDKVRCISTYGCCFTGLCVQFVDGSPLEPQLQVLRDICLNCSDLRVLDIVHPARISFRKVRVLRSYVAYLKNIVDRNERLERIGLSLDAYEPISAKFGIYEVFTHLCTSSHRISKLLDRVVFSHRVAIVKPVHILMTCPNLRELGCEIQCMTTESVDNLMKNTSLLDLHLRNDDTTQAADWRERFEIDWTRLKTAHADHKLRVHYVIARRSFLVEMLIENPFLWTLNLDIRFGSLYRDIVYECAMLYHESLRALLLQSDQQYWPKDTFDALDNMHGLILFVTRKLFHLQLLVLAVPVSPHTVLTIAANKRVSELHVLDAAVQFGHELKHERQESNGMQESSATIVQWWQEHCSQAPRLSSIVARFSKGGVWSLKTQREINAIVRRTVNVFDA